ncbi:MAG: hypothetical protein AABW63_01620 [Nanoarchaeota archaeon]
MKKQLYFIVGITVIIGVALIILLLQNPSKPEEKKENITENTSVIGTGQAYLLNETQCIERGYSWVPRPGLCAPGIGCGYTCDIPTGDSGKKCYSNSECQGACLCSKSVRDSEGYLIGECSNYKFSTEVSDCPCILVAKSKTGFISGCA